MTHPTDAIPTTRDGGGLRRRDWILLPLLALLTIVVIFAIAEVIARRCFNESTTNLEDCLVLTDSVTGVRGIPNAVCEEKYREGPLVEFRLDQAGYRSGGVGGPKAPGVYRIVLIGSSIAMGERVPFEQTFAALLPKKLSQLSGRRIELYNEGMAYGFARGTSLRLQDAFAADPDMILWLLSPLDVERADFDFAKESFNHVAPPQGKLEAMKNWVLNGIRRHGGDIVIGFALRHWLYEIQSQSQYVRSYLLNRPDDGESGFLRAQLSPEWEDHLKAFGSYAADIARQASAAGIPLVATLVPNRPLAAMISLGEWPAGFDPYKLDKELQLIVTEDQGTYIDLLPSFRNVPGVEHLYFPIDGHPDGRGQALFADLLTEKFSESAFAQLMPRQARAADQGK